ncbi:MAG: UDP-N-acetylmuramate dehydrogenase [Gammaproteobacteria bacterium]|nr:UDP-N-acetylmuramate dehydrogenase [Gammaproteobacteria bacterium]
MMAEQRQAALRGELMENEAMSRHTSWRVGGPAERLYKPADLDDLALFLSQLTTDEPLFWLGLGSNLLVRDGGIRGTVILTTNLLAEMERLEGNVVRAEAGVPCAKVARFCARQGLVGVEFLAGIPGTMGGALAMNAGAFGGETWDKVVAVETLDRRGQRHLRRPDEYEVAYRHVHGPQDEWFVAAHLQLETGDTESGRQRIRELLDKRGASQPTKEANAGSVFRNPQGDHSARLIEHCGLKGHCIGKACVSDKHANFIINTGGASAAQIEALIEEVAAIVKDKTGITLQREVRIVGEPV